MSPYLASLAARARAGLPLFDADCYDDPCAPCHDEDGPAVPPRAPRTGPRARYGEGVVYKRHRRFFAQFRVRGVRRHVPGSFPTESAARKAARLARLAELEQTERENRE